MRAWRAALALTLLTSLTGVSSARPLSEDRADETTELAGAFVVGPAITGAAHLDGYLYVTTVDRLSIYDVRDPTDPQLVGTEVSPNTIYGELISTDGDTLLLNNSVGARTLDIWNVEDKTSPTLVRSIPGVRDEHVSCLLRCTWAYGSDGTILELGAERPWRSENWLQTVGLSISAHRVDEFRNGFMATAPRAAPPQILDVRNPLHPRVVATARVPQAPPTSFLYSTWARRGNDRFLITSGEMGRCEEDWRGALSTFDTSSYPQRRALPLRDTYRHGSGSDDEDEGCSAYYFSLHPDFRDGGTILLPAGLDGVRILEIDGRGEIEEVDGFFLPFADVWLSFWINDEIFYALNRTGEVYIVRYTPT